MDYEPFLDYYDEFCTSMFIYLKRNYDKFSKRQEHGDK